MALFPRRIPLVLVAGMAACTLLNLPGWNIHNSGDEVHPVAQLRPNAWGLYDRAGNVWEWVDDGYSDYPDSAVTDPTGPANAENRVTRGGSYGPGGPQSSRAAYRNSGEPSFRDEHVGFRLARSRPSAL